MILTTTRRVRAYLGGAITTNQPEYNCSWVDINGTNYITTPDSTGGALNSTTPVEIIAVAPSGYKRQAKSIYVHNTDTVAVTAIFEVYDGATARRWYVAALDPGWTVEWEWGGSWKVYDANGRQRIETPAAVGGGGVAIAAGGATASSGTVLFSNANGITFGLAGSVMTASHNGITSQTDQTIGLYASSQTTGPGSSGTVDARSMSFIGAGQVSVGYSGGALVISASSAPQTNQTLGLYMVSNTTQGSSGTQDARSLSFQGAGIVSVGYTNGSIVISATGGGGGVTPALSGSNGSFSFSTATFGALNGITFYTSNGSMVASHNALTSQSNQAASGSNGSFTFQTLSFGASNGLTLYTSNSSIIGSYTVPTQSVQPVAASGSNGSFNFSTITFGALNGITFYTSNNSMVASHNALTSQSNQAASGSNGSFTFQTLSFGNSNGLSFYSNGSQIVASYTVPTQTNQTLGFYAVGNTTQSSSGTMDARTISFNALGIASVGVSNGSILISVPSGGGGITNINVSAGTTSQNLSNLVFADAGGVSFGLNGSTITASAPAGGAGPTLKFYDHVQQLNNTVAMTPMASTQQFQPVHWHDAYSFDHFRFPISMSGVSTTFSVSGGAGAFTASNVSTMWIMLYSLNTGASSQSLSLLSSRSAGWTHLKSITMNTSSTNTQRAFTVSHYWTYPFRGGTTTTSASSTGSGVSLSINSQAFTAFTGARMLDIPWGSTIPGGCYWIAMAWSSATGSQSFSAATGGRLTIAHMAVSQTNAGFGYPGFAGVSSIMPGGPGLGFYTTNAIGPTSGFNISAISSQASNPLFGFQGIGGIAV